MGLLDGKKAIVTGGGRGIGRGIALGLADAGADLAVVDLDLGNAEAVAQEVEARGRCALAHRVDVADPASVREGVAAVMAAFGGVDVLVNNAGVVPETVGGEFGEADFDRCQRVNVNGIWHTSTALVPHFRERGAGKIVNIASIAGRHGNAQLAPYCASKAAAISLTQSLASALGPDGINVKAVCPGLLWTEMWRTLEGGIRRTTDDAVIDERAAFDRFLAERCPLRREQTPEDIAHAVVFLASENARNITGQALNVDGGIEMN